MYEVFRDRIALTAHRYSHNTVYLEDTEDYDLNSNLNMREFYITDKAGNYIEDIDEENNCSLKKLKTVTSLEKLKFSNTRSQLRVSRRRGIKTNL